MRIAIIQLYTPDIAEYAAGNIQKTIDYCAEQGYSFHLYSKSLDESRPPSWSKLLAIKEQLSNYDWVMWMDADARIMNKNIKLEDIIKNTNHVFLFPKDGRIFNAGIFFVKNCMFAHVYLDKIYNTSNGKYTPDWWDNAAMLHLYDTDEKFKKSVKIIDKRLCNSYLNDYQEGDFIIHLAGQNKEVRINYFNKL